MTKHATLPATFEPEFVEGVKAIFEEKVVFNRVLGLQITSVLPQRVTGSIDMRVDYLRPAIGDRFDMWAEVMRIGSRVASTRMEFHAADGTLLSTGTAAYIVS